MLTMGSPLFDRLRELKRTYWANKTYLRRNRWESLLPALSSAVSGPTIFFYPDYPHENYIIRKLCAYGGIEATSRPDFPFDVGFFFTDQTFASSPESSRTDRTFINVHCTDISKSNVQSEFENAFGYSLSVDPCSYTGYAIEKSNKNAKKDATVVSCPIESVKSFQVYQKYIDNKIGENIYLDYRTTIIGNSIPSVVKKYWRDDKGQMPGTVVEAVAARPQEVFTPKEIKDILCFADNMGMDFGELDILRDNQSGRIYIVDANNTPIGPRKELSDRDYHKVLSRMLAAFHQHLLPT